MKLKTFFEKFDQFADAPNAIPAMRELILQLAVRGSLTDRAKGESCDAQLKLAEAFRLDRNRRGEPDAADIPFPIPAKWGWVAVGDSMHMINGKAFKPDEWSTEGTPIIRIQNLNNENGGFNYCKADLDPKIHVNDGEFLISWSGTPGTSFGAFIWNRGFAYLNQHIFRCELVKGVFVKEFLRLAINARLDEMISHAQGAVGLRHITKGKLESIRLPLPPLAEQKRIVAKVDELMALCDRLEAQQQERQTRHADLSRASLARFADAPTPANLRHLFHPSYTIPPADLRKSILTLAVQGKLVPQNPKDEPAEDVLERLISLTAKGGKIPKPLLSIDEEALPFDLPFSWKWVQAQDLCRPTNLITYGVLKPVWVESGVPTVRVQDIQNGVIVVEGVGQCSPERAAKFGKTTLVEGDLLIAKDGATLGKTGFVPSSLAGGNITQHVLRFPITPHVDRVFIRLVIDSPHGQAWMKGETKGVALPGVNVGDFRRMPIPLPSFAEQRRIVAKVDQLMALVDELETQLAASRATAKNLLQALVAELTDLNQKPHTVSKQ